MKTQQLTRLLEIAGIAPTSDLLSRLTEGFNSHEVTFLKAAKPSDGEECSEALETAEADFDYITFKTGVLVKTIDIKSVTEILQQNAITVSPAATPSSDYVAFVPVENVVEIEDDLFDMGVPSQTEAILLANGILVKKADKSHLMKILKNIQSGDRNTSGEGENPSSAPDPENDRRNAIVAAQHTARTAQAFIQKNPNHQYVNDYKKELQSAQRELKRLGAEPV